MIIQQIRNATLKITYGDQTILLDPWLEAQGQGPAFPTVRADMRARRSPLDALPLSPNEILRGVDCLLVSHVHPDHFAPHHLPPDIRVIAQNERDAGALNSMGFVDVISFSDDTLQLGAVSVTRAEGVHGDTPEAAKRMGPVSGFVLRHPKEKTLYLCGDTMFYEGVARTIRQYRPEVIAVNCCAATIPAGRLIMDAEDVLQTARLAGGARIIATHLDSVNHALLTREDIRRFVREHGLENVLVPENGEIIRC